MARELLWQVGGIKHIWLWKISDACLADEMPIWAEVLSQTRPCGLGLVVLFQRVLEGQTQRRGVRGLAGFCVIRHSELAVISNLSCYFTV